MPHLTVLISKHIQRPPPRALLGVWLCFQIISTWLNLRLLICQYDIIIKGVEWL